MKLLPIRARATEGTQGPCELFFINGSKFTLEYFFAYVLPFLPGEHKEDPLEKIDSSTMQIYADISGQIVKYTADINKFKSLYTNPKIHIEIDFKIPEYLSIEDKVCFVMPIQNEPEIYARDIFQVYSIPEGELLPVFSFYIRESILAYIQECILNREIYHKEWTQQTEPNVCINSTTPINQALIIYESFGKVAFLKETTEKKRKKKQGTGGAVDSPFCTSLHALKK